MRVSPELEGLRGVPWQLFCTFTFKDCGPAGLIPSPRKRSTMLFSTFRDLASFSGIHFRSLLWLVRGEFGEIGGRFHYHALIAGLPPSAVTTRRCLSLMSQWESHGGGMARVRLFDDSLDGVSYCLKDVGVGALAGANAYELSKFGGACDVTLSKSLLEAFERGRWVGQTRLLAQRKAAQTGAVSVVNASGDNRGNGCLY